jgi:hypothetical protein
MKITAEIGLSRWTQGPALAACKAEDKKGDNTDKHVDPEPRITLI